MTKKALLINTPRELFDKMTVELNDFKNDPKSSRHAINFTLTAYHLREWIWKSILEKNLALRNSISDEIVSEKKFNDYTNKNCPELILLKEIANNVKHFHYRDDKNKIFQTRSIPTIDKIDCTWDKLEVPVDYDGLIAVTDDKRWISILDLFNNVHKYWKNFFDNYLRQIENDKRKL